MTEHPNTKTPCNMQGVSEHSERIRSDRISVPGKALFRRCTGGTSRKGNAAWGEKAGRDALERVFRHDLDSTEKFRRYLLYGSSYHLLSELLGLSF